MDALPPRTSSLAIDSTGRIPLCDSEGLKTITGLGSVTQELELFREQIAQHVSSVTVSLETADQQLVDLYSAVTSSHEKIKSTAAAADAATASAGASCTAVENLTGRLKKAETALDVLPAWKAAYEAKGKAADEAAKAREREASARCDRLESLLDALQTRIWQRFESLEDLVMKGAEARGKQGEDIMKLKTESAVFREGLAAADTSLRSLTATSSTHSRNLETAAAEGMQTAAKIKILQEETNNLLNMTEELTSTTTRLAMTTDITSSGMEVMRGDFEDAERSMRSLTERVVLIEADTRAEDALEATKDIAEISEEVGQVQKDLEEGLAELNARVEEVAEVAEAGPQAFQDLLESSEELKASTKSAHEQLVKLDSRLAATKSAVDAQNSLGEAAMTAAGDAGRAVVAVGARLDAESKRLTAYCDKVAQPLARSVQLNEVREQIAALKSTLAEDAVHTKEDLKFELMHEKSPQFSNLKDFISAQERNTARLSERLTLAEEAASLARSDAADSVDAFSTLRAETSAHQEGGSELRGQLTALMTRMHELQGLVDAAKEEAGAASQAVAVAAARDVNISREQVNEIVSLAAAKARKGAHPSWALSTPGALQQGARSMRSAGGDMGSPRERSATGGEDAEGEGGLQAYDPSFGDAEASQLRASSVQSTGRGSRAAGLLALRASTSGAESVWGASDMQPRHACVSQEHAVLAKDLATSLLEVHKKSHCSQAFNDYVQVVENDYGVIKSHKEHCKLMKGVNVVLDRLMRKRAANAADFTVTCVAVHDMRLCLLERIVAKMQETLSDVAQAASRAGKVADSAAAEASGKVPASLGNEMLAGMHALVRILGESLVAGLSREGLASMKQVVENKVHAYVSTHGPKLMEISRSVNGSPPATARPVSSPTSGPKTTSTFRRGVSAPSKPNIHCTRTAPMPQARIPGKLLSVEESTHSHRSSPERPYTAGAAVQSAPHKLPADALMHSLAENSAPQRRVRSAHPDRSHTHNRGQNAHHQATAERHVARLSPNAFFQGEHRGHPGAPGVPAFRPSSSVNASFYRSRRDLVAEQQHAPQRRNEGRDGGARIMVNPSDDVQLSMHEGLTESLDISPLAPAAPGPSP